MLVVHIWRFRGKDVCGHASMTIRGAAGTDYIRWWPQGTNRRRNVSETQVCTASQVIPISSPAWIDNEPTRGSI